MDSDQEWESSDEFLFYAPLKPGGVYFLALFQSCLAPEKSHKVPVLKLDLGTLAL